MASRDPARSRRHSRRRRSPTSSEEATSPADANTGEALADGPAAPANIPATDPASQFREAHADRLDSLRGALVARAAKGTDRSTGSAARRSPSRGRGVRRRRAREKAEPRDQVQCPVCGTKCHAQGLEQHQLYSAYCKGQRDRWAGWMQCLACLSWHGSDEAFEQHCQAKHPEGARSFRIPRAEAQDVRDMRRPTSPARPPASTAGRSSRSSRPQPSVAPSVASSASRQLESLRLASRSRSPAGSQQHASGSSGRRGTLDRFLSVADKILGGQ